MKERSSRRLTLAHSSISSVPVTACPHLPASSERVAKTTDFVKEGQKVWVKLMGFDERGKVRLSMKVVDQETGKEIVKEKAEEGGE